MSLEGKTMSSIPGQEISFLSDGKRSEDEQMMEKEMKINK